MTALRFINAEGITFNGDKVHIKLHGEKEELVLDAKLRSVWLYDESIVFLVDGVAIDWQITLDLNWQVSIAQEWRHV